MGQESLVKVFIGSGEASLLERKTLIYSLRQHTSRDLDIYVLNGTHNAVELNDGEPFLSPMSLRVKYRNVTEFSLYRFLIPEICNYKGKAIYVDSDTVCLTDIGTLFDTPIDGYDFLAKKEAYANADIWGLSVMMINCESCRFDLESILDEVDRGLYLLSEFLGMSQAFLVHHPYMVGELDPYWNVFDYWDQHTQLIHYTNLHTQPWKYQNHLYGELWFQYFNKALESGYITQHDIELSLDRAYARFNLLEGNFSGMGSQMSVLKKTFNSIKPLVKKILRSSSVISKSV